MSLGPLEMEVLRVMKKLGKASARQVLRELSSERELAYTTIITTLERLRQKGLLRRESIPWRGGAKYLYSGAQNEKKQEQIVGKAVNALIEAFGSVAVSTIYKRLEEIPEEKLESLKAKVKERRGR